MSLKWCIQAGRFGDDCTVAEPLDRLAVAAVLERFVDRGEDGVPIPGRQNPRLTAWTVLGSIDREAVLLRANGVIEVNLLGSGHRMNSFLAALVRDLGCRLLAADSYEWVTEYFLDLADRPQAHAQPSAAHFKSMAQTNDDGMTQEQAEERVWLEWGQISESQMGCAMRVDATRTETYEWGWVVTFVPVRREDCPRHCILDCYTISPAAGRSYPVGSKGLDHTLRQLGVITDAAFRGLSTAERQALWDRLTRRRT